MCTWVTCYHLYAFTNHLLSWSHLNANDTQFYIKTNIYANHSAKSQPRVCEVGYIVVEMGDPSHSSHLSFRTLVSSWNSLCPLTFTLNSSQTMCFLVLFIVLKGTQI